MNILKLLGWLFSAIALLLFVIGWIVYTHTKQFLESSIVVTGVVTELAERSSTSGTNTILYFPIVSFDDNSGGVHSFESSFGSSSPKYQVGDSLEVRFDPLRPKRARIEGFFSSWLAVIVLSGLTLMFSVPGVFMLTFSFSCKRKQQILESRGRLITTEVVSIELDKQTVVDGTHPWRIYSKWIDPMSGDECLFKSSCMSFDPSCYLTRERIRVKIDTGNIKNYKMDLSFIPSSRKDDVFDF